jgi:hypothetical protein
MRKSREKEGENSAAVQQTLAGPLPSSYVCLFWLPTSDTPNNIEDDKDIH